ncbi:2-oxoglutarate-acceptor oxidoreductase subunit OorD [Anaerohalosphaera lusitana]|uniref:2-oxoglutarate-acceptor oxidoreductase subunit OorD n=1 Tax=Anaerohalosphaera lusitana TaxID=1936003 RepID=A0A1U9NL24_9BACT|nr:tungsten formylmethanofuran dehydrogenase [Anaerohalosphaera lusitana]AQT68428.1 2-oxoglutarate-acceptor oxidoreductase subunit OorD [Anaerohalosphaera lusitana]
MADINIDKKKCKGCCLCVSCCPRGNIEMSDEPNEAGAYYACIIDEKECTGCAICCQMCPDVAIEIEE